MALSLVSNVARQGLNLPLPAYFFLFSILAYVFGRSILAYLQSAFQDARKIPVGAVNLDQAEKGGLVKPNALSEADEFGLEKRAFFSKTWLFVCHRSRFEKPGDYHAFDVAGITFFVVLGKDLRLRAFHNVCRHRAYTVVRKACGTSTRFSCKYHGWQYDDQGKLVKAPKFENFPSFKPEENGLYEIKLIQTQDGLVFVNFDASTMNLPFNNVKSHIDLDNCSWVTGFDVSCATNWKDVANEFSSQAHWSQNPFGWFSKYQKKKLVSLLGPVSIIKELNHDLWCTMTLLPRSSAEVITRCDIYAKEGHQVQKAVIEKWKWMLEREIGALSHPEPVEVGRKVKFSYKIGGRSIDLSAILLQHQRNEDKAKRRLQPAIRVSGTADVDMEAAALCDSLDNSVTASKMGACSKMSNFNGRMDW